jgi:hypothetical protein
MFSTLQEAQNIPAGASVPALGLSNKAICSFLYRKNRPEGASVPALGLYNKAICFLLYRKPRRS